VTATAGAAVLTGAAPAAGVPATAVPAWVQQAVQAQLSGRLVAAARGADPSALQRLTLHLHPADLGVVQVVATMHDGTVSLQLMAGNPLTRDAMRASLATLHADLAAAGLSGTQLDVSDQPPSQQGAAQQQPGTSSDGSSRHFAGSGADGRLAAGGPGGAGRQAPPVVAGLRPGHPGTPAGVDLHL
jgi:flagellar hook-length control protein FliK